MTRQNRIMGIFWAILFAMSEFVLSELWGGLSYQDDAADLCDLAIRLWPVDAVTAEVDCRRADRSWLLYTDADSVRDRPWPESR